MKLTTGLPTTALATTALALALTTAAPLAASAQSQEEQNACIGDAFSVCGHAIPDRGRVAACLAGNINRVSPACRAVMARYPKPPADTQRYAQERRAPYGLQEPRQWEPRQSYERSQPGWRYEERRFGERPWHRDEPGHWREPPYYRTR